MPISPQELMGVVGWGIGLGFAGLVVYMVLMGDGQGGRKGRR